ncbi:MAG: hypothetical protein AB4058_02735 [Microcystaceae cyanobacterium]
MDKIFYQLTVLATAACVGVISLSILFPASRQANTSALSPNMTNNTIIIDSQNN